MSEGFARAEIVPFERRADSSRAERAVASGVTGFS